MINTEISVEKLYEYSRKVLLDNQQPGGGYLACPVMPDYQFSWFRDGAFIAYALTIDGAHDGIAYKQWMAAQWDSVSAFHDWCATRVNDRREALERTIARAARGEALVLADTLNARYKADGSEGPGDWPEFQLDGAGLWLWSLEYFVKAQGITPLPENWSDAIRLTARYLASLWDHPCNDCWEEQHDKVHTSTLASIYAGLSAARRMLPELRDDPLVATAPDAIRAYILQNGLTPQGELAKIAQPGGGFDAVDANLLTAALPGGLFAPTDPIMVKTVARIERELRPANSGGVYRYLKDVYYGGGPWVLLGLWLAWYYTQTGDMERARELVGWAEHQADADGNLPEQVNHPLLSSQGDYERWVQMRGEIACPLLWTHAMYMTVQLQRFSNRLSYI
jgi:GH15 family glucan-1,4-alpha-glucosidase